jgi:hypothetical protein
MRSPVWVSRPEERAQRAADEVALCRVVIGCSFLECPSELRVDLGRAVAEAWPASAAKLADVVAALRLVDERIDHLVGDGNERQ